MNHYSHVMEMKYFVIFIHFFSIFYIEFEWLLGEILNCTLLTYFLVSSFLHSTIILQNLQSFLHVRENCFCCHEPCSRMWQLGPGSLKEFHSFLHLGYMKALASSYRYFKTIIWYSLEPQQMFSQGNNIWTKGCKRTADQLDKM